MAYSKTTWASGDTITAAKLNNAEAGIAANADAIDELNTNMFFLTLSLESVSTTTIQTALNEIWSELSTSKIFVIRIIRPSDNLFLGMGFGQKYNAGRGCYLAFSSSSSVAQYGRLVNGEWETSSLI